MRRFDLASFIVLGASLCACGDGSGSAVFASSASDHGSGGRGHAIDAGAVDGGDGSVAAIDGSLGAGGADAGMDSGVGLPPPPPGAPVVEILEPAAAADPNTDTVVTTNTLFVRCRVARATEPMANDVDQSTIKIKAQYKDGSTSKTVDGAVVAKPDNVFEASFNLSDVPNGPIQFRCSANDTANPANTGFEVIDTFIDLGPAIQIVEPKDKRIYALKKDVLVKFEVKPAKVSGGDKEAKPKSIHLDVSGRSFDFEEDPKQPGLYTQNIPFYDKNVFPVALVDAAVTVSAASSRTPKAPTRSEKVAIILDSDGPSVSISNYSNNNVVHGKITLRLTITDASGVDESTIAADINSQEFVLTKWVSKGSNVYETTFDTFQLPSATNQLTIDFRAWDKVGNESPVNSATLLLNVDNVAPIVSLDPPFIREWTMTNNMKVCSDPFDPVGEDAASDGQIVQSSSVYRALVEDGGNCSPGAVLCYLADINPKAVALYVQPKPNIPLLKDLNNDGLCDINYSSDMGSDLPTVLQLSALGPRGSAYYSAGLNKDDPRNIADADCNAGTGTDPPSPICETTLMTRVIPEIAFISGQQNGIFAISPKDPACAGNSWELSSVAGEGWHCLAARAEDNIGNVGISLPIRVCVDDGDDSNGVPSCDPMDMPSCVDNCSLPLAFSPNMTVKAR